MDVGARGPAPAPGQPEVPLLRGAGRGQGPRAMLLSGAGSDVRPLAALGGRCSLGNPGTGAPAAWPPCLRRAGLLPTAVTAGAERSDVRKFTRRLYGMFLAVLAARLDKEQAPGDDGRERHFPENPARRAGMGTTRGRNRWAWCPGPQAAPRYAPCWECRMPGSGRQPSGTACSATRCGCKGGRRRGRSCTPSWPWTMKSSRAGGCRIR